MIRIAWPGSRPTTDRATTQLNQASSGKDKGKEKASPPAAKDEGGLYVWRVVFHVADGSAQFAVSVRNSIMLGRGDPTTGSKPDIDLTGFGGHDSGVSRYHAIVIPTDEGLCIIDLDTANGTSINGQKLVSGRRYRLRGGDRLELGTLRLMVNEMGLVPRGRTQHSTIIVNRKTAE